MKKTTVAAVLLVLVALVILGVITAMQPSAEPSLPSSEGNSGEGGQSASGPNASVVSGGGESSAPASPSAAEDSSIPEEHTSSEDLSAPEESSLPPKDPAKKYIAFTFDDGPYAPVTSKLLDKLESIDGRATFFVVGNRLNDSTGKLLARASSLGCEIGSHSYTHTVYFNNCTDAQMEEELSKKGIEPLHRDVDQKWIALDYGSVIVHVFYKELREFYDIERLWAEGDNIKKFID